jgi:hypothetical protein
VRDAWNLPRDRKDVAEADITRISWKTMLRVTGMSQCGSTLVTPAFWRLERKKVEL